MERFWETYQGTAEGDLVEFGGEIGGHVLGALLLGAGGWEIAGGILAGMRRKQERIAGAAMKILKSLDASGIVRTAIDLVSGWLDKLP